MTPPRQILILGTLPWFADSFRIFLEAGFRGAFIRTQGTPHPWWSPVFPLLQEIGFQEILESEAEAFIRAGECTIVYSGGELFPSGSYLPSGDSIEKLSLFERVSYLVRQKALPAFSIRFFNGETYFITRHFTETVATALQHADALFYDNDRLRAYVEYNCPRLASTPGFDVLTEAPLERFFSSAVGRRIKPEIVISGRLPPSPLDFPAHRGKPTLRHRVASVIRRLSGRAGPAIPRSVREAQPAQIVRDSIADFDRYRFPYPLVTSPRRVALAPCVAQLHSERRAMAAESGNCVGGLSHFYDFPWHSRNRHSAEEFGFEAQQLALANPFGYGWTQVMRRINLASKAITYLMIGLPPIVPDDDEQPLTRILKSNDMCFAIGSKDLSWTNEMVSEAAIDHKRRQVARHARLLAFERVVECINRVAADKLKLKAFVPLPKETTNAPKRLDVVATHSPGPEDQDS